MRCFCIKAVVTCRSNSLSLVLSTLIILLILYIVYYIAYYIVHCSHRIVNYLKSKTVNSVIIASTREKAMAPHSSTLAWKIPWMEEPGRLQSMGSWRVGHNWVTSLSLFMNWRRKWQPTPVFLPGESQGRGSLVGCRLWGHTESDTTEVT